MGERTVASVKADDEARLLLDFLRHFGGRGVVDGEGSRAQRLSWISRSAFSTGHFSVRLGATD